MQIGSPNKEETPRPSQASIEQVNRLKKIVRDLEAKLEMVSEIALGNDLAESKVKMIM